ncbi:unnamed protein product [Cylicocyclus nassatus]|uniref:Uncharacterized protein n=1 Tax=Cylicocyclus nassatus TaxID=53992 RepID=A0AA36DMN1_CYLNA|nr:unnamed protein product [Cylicocyclus nassatus]
MMWYIFNLLVAMGGAFSSRKKKDSELLSGEGLQNPTRISRLISQDNEKLDTDADREEGKANECLKTHEVISGIYLDMKLWSNFVPPPRP